MFIILNFKFDGYTKKFSNSTPFFSYTLCYGCKDIEKKTEIKTILYLFFHFRMSLGSDFQ